MDSLQGELRERVRIRPEWEEFPAAAEAAGGPPPALPARDRGSQPLGVGLRNPERPLRGRAHDPRADIEGVDLSRRGRILKPSGPARRLCTEIKPTLLVRTGERGGLSGSGEAWFGTTRRGLALGFGFPLLDRHSL